MAVASAGPYVNNQHLAPDMQPHQHLIIQFLQAGCSSMPNQQCQSTEGMKLHYNTCVDNWLNTTWPGLAAANPHEA